MGQVYRAVPRTPAPAVVIPEPLRWLVDRQAQTIFDAGYDHDESDHPRDHRMVQEYENFTTWPRQQGPMVKGIDLCARIANHLTDDCTNGDCECDTEEGIDLCLWHAAFYARDWLYALVDEHEGHGHGGVYYEHYGKGTQTAAEIAAEYDAHEVAADLDHRRRWPERYAT